MTSSGTKLRAATVAIGTMLLMAGCGNDENSSPTATESSNPTNSAAATPAADVPRGFDPCTGIPAEVLASENLKATSRKDTDAPGGIKWRGCGWVKRQGYSVGITTTNLTRETVLTHNFPDTREFTIGGRRAVSTRRPNDDTGCWVNVEMNGGTLEFLLDNPKSSPATGSIDPCELAKILAEKVVPSVPAGT